MSKIAHEQNSLIVNVLKLIKERRLLIALISIFTITLFALKDCDAFKSRDYPRFVVPLGLPKDGKTKDVRPGSRVIHYDTNTSPNIDGFSDYGSRYEGYQLKY